MQWPLSQSWAEARCSLYLTWSMRIGLYQFTLMTGGYWVWNGRWATAILATGSELLLRSDSGSDGDTKGVSSRRTARCAIGDTDLITELIPLPAGEPATQPCQSDSSTSSFGKQSYSGGIFEFYTNPNEVGEWSRWISTSPVETVPVPAWQEASSESGKNWCHMKPCNTHEGEFNGHLSRDNNTCYLYVYV